MIRPAVLIKGLAAAGLLIGISACTQHQAASGTASTPAPVEKAFTLTATAPFHVDFLTGQLQDLKITEQVDAAGKVAQPAELRGNAENHEQLEGPIGPTGGRPPRVPRRPGTSDSPGEGSGHEHNVQ